jgi:HAD superfamily hydrolase (TIGR01509 family)
VPIRALLLDFDGTLSDSLPALRRVYERFVTELGGAATDDEFDALNGPPLRDVVEHLCVTHQQRAHSKADIEKYERLVAEASGRILPAKGTAALLEAANASGIACAIVTSSKADLVKSWLEANGFAGRCDLIVSGEDVSEGKPGPEPYRLALARLGLNPEEALAIEDSPSGVQSARAAGIRTLWVGRPSEAGDGVAGIDTLNDALAHFVTPDGSGG